MPGHGGCTPAEFKERYADSGFFILWETIGAAFLYFSLLVSSIHGESNRKKDPGPDRS
jgi:hypothetical protein